MVSRRQIIKVNRQPTQQLQHRKQAASDDDEEEDEARRVSRRNVTRIRSAKSDKLEPRDELNQEIMNTRLQLELALKNGHARARQRLISQQDRRQRLEAGGESPRKDQPKTNDSSHFRGQHETRQSGVSNGQKRRANRATSPTKNAQHKSSRQGQQRTRTDAKTPQDAANCNQLTQVEQQEAPLDMEPASYEDELGQREDLYRNFDPYSIYGDEDDEEDVWYSEEKLVQVNSLLFDLLFPLASFLHWDRSHSLRAIVRLRIRLPLPLPLPFPFGRVFVLANHCRMNY